MPGQDSLIDRITDQVMQELQKRGALTALAQQTPEIPGLAGLIDHTLLKPDARRDDIIKLCREALQYNFCTVCINPGWVRLAADILRGSAVKVCTVAGFPLGAGLPDVKAYETRRAILDGAAEVDMVINLGALKSRESGLVTRDIRSVVQAAEDHGAQIKVILETCLLNTGEKIEACRLSKAAGAHFVKTSTGFSSGGAKVEDIRLMRQTVGKEMGVKASGGIRSRQDAMKMIEAGASRLGTSSGVLIVTGG